MDLPASIEAAWGLRERPHRGPKPGLSLAGIVDAGVQVAEAEGLAAVSMSRVAAELGTAPMSLYRYISAKNELIALMVDTVYREFLVPAAADKEWREGLSALAWAMRAVMYAHPWVLGVPTQRAARPPQRGRLVRAGARLPAGYRARRAEKASVILLVSGYVRNEASTNADIQAAIRASGAAPSEWMSAYGGSTKLTDPEHFPALTQFIASGVFEQFDPPDREFSFGMERILDGIGDLVAARSAAPADPPEPGGPPEPEAAGTRAAPGARGVTTRCRTRTRWRSSSTGSLSPTTDGSATAAGPRPWRAAGHRCCLPTTPGRSRCWPGPARGGRRGATRVRRAGRPGSPARRAAPVHDPARRRTDPAPAGPVRGGRQRGTAARRFPAAAGRAAR